MDKHHSKVNLVSEVGIGTTFWIDLEACLNHTPLLVQSTETSPRQLQKSGKAQH